MCNELDRIASYKLFYILLNLFRTASKDIHDDVIPETQKRLIQPLMSFWLYWLTLYSGYCYYIIIIIRARLFKPGWKLKKQIQFHS